MIVPPFHWLSASLGAAIEGRHLEIPVAFGAPCGLEESPNVPLLYVYRIRYLT
jgi:hypothetical protein